MRLRLRAMMLTLVVFGIVASSPSVVKAQGPELIDGPDGGNTIALRLAPGTTAAAVTAYLRQDGSEPVTGVLQVDQLTSEGMGGPPGSGTVTISRRGGEPDAPVTIPPAPALVPVTISVESLETVGTFTTNVTLATETQSLPLGQVTIVKLPTVTFSFVGADTDGLAIAADRPVVRRWIQIDSATDEDVTVTVSISALIGPDGRQACATVQPEGAVSPTACDQPAASPQPSPSIPCECSGLVVVGLTVPANGSIRVLLTARVETDGAYETVATVAWTGARLDVPITITRTFSVSPFEIHGPPVVRAERWPFLNSTRTFTIVADPSSLRPFTLPAPDFVIPLTREDGGTSESADINVAFNPTQAMNVQDGHSVSYDVTLSGIPAQGAYNGTIKWSATDHQGATFPVKLVVRDSWLVALIIIAGGLLLGYLVTTYLRDLRPRWARERALQEYRVRITSLVVAHRSDGDVGPVVAEMLRRTERLLVENAAGSAAASDLDERTEIVRLQVDAAEPWIDLLPLVRLLRDLKPADDALKTFEEVRKALVNDGPLSSTRVEVGRLGNLRTDLPNAVKNTLSEQLEACRQLVSDVSAWASPVDLDRIKTAVDPGLGDARDHLAKGNLTHAAHKLRESQAPLIGTVARAMADLVSKPAPFLRQAQWKPRLDGIGDGLRAIAQRSASNPDDEIANLARIRHSFYELAYEALKAWISTQQPAKVGEVKSAADALGVALAVPDSKEAALAYANAARSAEQVVAKPRGVAKPAELVTQEVGVRYIPDPTVVKVSVPWHVKWLPLIADGVVFAVLFAVGTIVGLGVLWASNETWGSMTDLATAFALGFGLNAAGAPASTATLDSLWRQFAKPLTA